MPNSVQPVILAAGKGTRMNSELPKVLVELRGQPLIVRLLNNISTAAFGYPPVIVVGYKSEQVRGRLGPAYLYAFQPDQLGTANALAAAQPQIRGRYVIVMYGDMPFITAATLENLMQLHLDTESKFSMLTATVPHFREEYAVFNGFGRIIRDKAGKLQKIAELVDADEHTRAIREVNPGIYLFETTWLWRNLPDVKRNQHGEYYLTDLLEIAIAQKLSVVTASVDPAEVFGINTPGQLEHAARFC